MADTQKMVAQIVGIVLTVVGVAGFFVTDSLLGFGVNGAHNVIHLLSGLLGVGAGFYAAGQWARDYNKWLGVVYLAVAVLGFFWAGFAGWLNINAADNILHLVLGVVLAGVGFGVNE